MYALPAKRGASGLGNLNTTSMECDLMETDILESLEDLG